jgi:hypothetical protein
LKFLNCPYSKNAKQNYDMKKFYPTLIIFLLCSSTLMKAQLAYKQAGLRLGYRSGFFYQVTSDAGNAEIGYNALLSFTAYWPEDSL